jgi:hypothetical protein
MNLTIRGNATSDEIAAVLVLMSQNPSEDDEDGYARWRRTRLAALRGSTGRRDASRCATIVR